MHNWFKKLNLWYLGFSASVTHCATNPYGSRLRIQKDGIKRVIKRVCIHHFVCLHQRLLYLEKSWLIKRGCPVLTLYRITFLINWISFVSDWGCSGNSAPIISINASGSIHSVTKPSREVPSNTASFKTMSITCLMKCSCIFCTGCVWNPSLISKTCCFLCFTKNFSIRARLFSAYVYGCFLLANCAIIRSENYI